MESCFLTIPPALSHASPGAARLIEALRYGVPALVLAGAGANEAAPGRDTLVAALLGQPNLKLSLEEPVEVIGMYGWRRPVREIRLRVDDAESLCADLERLIVRR